MKSAVIYRLEQAGQTAGGRGLIVEKSVVAYQGEPVEFGRRVQAEAYRRGLGTARVVYVMADGAVWIWRVNEDRFSQALGLLDFADASDHLWAVAYALHPEDQARVWVEPLLHQLRHGQDERVVRRLEELPWRYARRGASVSALHH